MLHDNFIADFTEDFGLRIVNLYKYLRKEKKEYIMSMQLYRSGTSIGANVAESKNAQSKADFISKLSIALKEAGESDYWLKLLLKSQTISIHEYDSIKNDLNIIIGTLIKIIKTTKENMKNSENK
jgi:four helix bundle protein